MNAKLPDGYSIDDLKQAILKAKLPIEFDSNNEFSLIQGKKSNMIFKANVTYNTVVIQTVTKSSNINFSELYVMMNLFDNIDLVTPMKPTTLLTTKKLSKQKWKLREKSKSLKEGVKVQSRILQAPTIA